VIPVRVPVDAPTYQVGGTRTLQPDNPMYGTLCPVCDEFLLDRPVALVYVGMLSGDRGNPRYVTGGAVVIHASCSAPGDRGGGKPWTHRYVSTACEHAHYENRPELHGQCRRSCKYAPDGIESCLCSCHTEGAPAELPPPWVDQARNAATRLLAVIERCGVDLRTQDPDLYEEIRDGRDMFWARGEVQPAGEWHPTNTNNEEIDDV